MWMNSFTNIHRISPHLNSQAHFTNQVTSVCANNAATNDAMGSCIKNEFSEAFITSISNCASTSSPWE